MVVVAVAARVYFSRIDIIFAPVMTENASG